jgi:hypothetical protein
MAVRLLATTSPPSVVVYTSVPQPVCRHKVKGVTRTFTYSKKLIVDFYSFYFIPVTMFHTLVFYSHPLPIV